MKKLLALMMSFSLIVSPVLAQAPADVAPKSGVTKDAYTDIGTEGTGKVFYLQQIAGLSTSAIGSSIITQCLEGLKVPSITTFMGGSLLNIMSEIIEGRAKNARNKQNVKDMELRDSDIVKSGDSNQLESLKMFLKEEEDTKKFLGNRKKWMIAVDLIYTTAAGLAVAELLTGKAASLAIEVSGCPASASAAAVAKCGLISAVPAIAAACVASQTPIEIGLCKLQIEKSKAMALLEPIPSLARAKGPVFCATAVAHTPVCLAAYNGWLTAVYGACLPAPVDGMAKMFSWPRMLGVAYGFGAGQLTKDGGKISSYGSTMLSLLNFAIPAASLFVEKSYNFPLPRAATFGALSAISILITEGLGSREKISEKNIAKLKSAIEKFKIETDGTVSGLGKDTLIDDPSTPSAGKKRTYELKTLAVEAPKTCLSDSSGKFEISEQACAKPFKIPKPNVGKFSIPVLGNVAALSAEMANALAENNIAGASDIADKIGTMAAQVRAANEQLKTNYNKSLVAQKQKPFDFEGNIKKQVAALQAQVSNAASANGMSMPAGGGVTSNPEVAAETAPEVTTASMAAVELPNAEPSIALDNLTEEMSDASLGSGRPAQSLDDFESAEADISKQDDVSIFKQVSNRYILNYTKMFETKKTLNPEPEPENK